MSKKLKDARFDILNNKSSDSLAYFVTRIGNIISILAIIVSITSIFTMIFIYTHW